LLDKMTSMYESGRIHARPNDYCYTSVINACAHCENDTLEKRDALKVFVDAYKFMISSSEPSLRPNCVTFSCAIGALRRLLPHSEERTAAVKKVFARCLEEGMCDHRVLTRLRTAVDEQIWEELVGAEISTTKREIEFCDVPVQWGRNVR
jgi:hypothetical protein